MTTKQQIKHLYWRAGFGLSPKEWEIAETLSLNEALAILFLGNKRSNKILPNPNFIAIEKGVSEKRKKELRELQKQSLQKQKAAWIARMANPKEDAFLERMSLFWHGHFACISRAPQLAVNQLNSIRKNALGDFRSLLLSISQDASMIRFLNNQQNRKQSPNENFAREVLELFTIGRGHYTEQDVKEAARAFTGWSSNQKGEFLFRKNAHDEGEKTFMGQSGNFNGDDIIDIILRRKETALFLTRKIYAYFVNPTINENRVYTLAKSFYESNYDIEQLMRSIFESSWFYEKENVGVKIKSPMDLVAGMMRTLEVSFATPAPLIRLQKILGQELFNPPNVAGWKGDKNWIDHATLMLRLNLVNHIVILAQKDANKYKKDEALEQMMSDMKQENFSNRGRTSLSFKLIVEQLEGKSSEEIYDELSDYLLALSPSLKRSDIEDYILKERRESYITSMTLRLMSLPEYQLC